MRLLPAVLGCLLAGTVTADVLEMPTREQAVSGGETVLRELPAKGMSMREVEQRFGAPVEKRDAVGNPPITRWIYDTYTVYFEHQYVVHAVLNR